jgi:hypothetical protein
MFLHIQLHIVEFISGADLVFIDQRPDSDIVAGPESDERP